MSRNQFFGHFVIIDIGHPMRHGSVLLIRKSLQNVLSLACNIRGVSRIPVFGYGVLAPSFQLVQQWKILIGNFLAIDKNLEYLENPVNFLQKSNIGAKVTPKGYRSFLENSVETTVTDFEYYANNWKVSTDPKERFNPLHYWPSQIHITLITRKGGSLILEILRKFQNYSGKLHKIEILEISNDEDKKPRRPTLRNDMNFISHSIITENDLDDTFKNWILGDYTHCEQLHIILTKDPVFSIKCDIYDCLINPAITTLPNTFSLSSISQTFTPQKPLHLTGYKQCIYEMEVVSKIGINNVCPSLFFGLPQWIYSTRTCITDWDELRYNAEIFKALCAQLYTAKIGFVTRLKPSSPFNKITPLYFITSDGVRLLMKNIVPVELKLPQRVITSLTVDDAEEEANEVVRSLIGQMETEKFSPQSLSIGVYEHFREHLKSELKKNSCRSVKTFYKAKPSKTSQCPNISPGEYTPKFLLESNSPHCDVERMSVKAKKTRKRNEEKEPIHPALMSPGSMAKYRKHKSNHYEPPEVMEPGVEEK